MSLTWDQVTEEVDFQELIKRCTYAPNVISLRNIRDFFRSEYQFYYYGYYTTKDDLIAQNLESLGYRVEYYPEVSEYLHNFAFEIWDKQTEVKLISGLNKILKELESQRELFKYDHSFNSDITGLITTLTINLQPTRSVINLRMQYHFNFHHQPR